MTASVDRALADLAALAEQHSHVLTELARTASPLRRVALSYESEQLYNKRMVAHDRYVRAHAREQRVVRIGQ